jgi:GNAT superfamily N-acetyltransferase
MDDLWIEAEPAPADVAALDDRLYDFNMAATGFTDGEALAIFVRDEGGALRAGISGHTWGGCCEIKQLWVRDDARGAGLGARLLAAAETEARRRGCALVTLSTHSFQAPAFYGRFGYGQVGAVEGYPRGHRQLYFAKAL